MKGAEPLSRSGYQEDSCVWKFIPDSGGQNNPSVFSFSMKAGSESLLILVLILHVFYPHLMDLDGLVIGWRGK